jgi:uncharacterized hydrophobic protein (TIGR00271 family)
MSETAATLVQLARSFKSHWLRNVVGRIDHADVVSRVRGEGGWNGHYAFMTLMSAGIAVLGLLLSSPAVVIGAMLISPLMGPIVALGFGLATFDFAEIRRSLAALGLGILLAVSFCALVVLLSPLQTVTPEIAARTRPNFFDLLVALFSGLAGAYAMIRGRHGAIVGVAIATALMPPLATVGFGLATRNGPVFGGAGLLFLTNLMVIALAAAIMARLYRFGHSLSPRQTRFQATLIVATFIILGVPLALALRQIAWEAVTARQASDIISSEFGREARLGDVQIDFTADPMLVTATVLTPTYRKDAEAKAAAALKQTVGRSVRLEIDQLRVGSGEADASQLTAARGAAANISATRIADRLALVANVDPDDVVVDAGHRRALVRAAALPGAGLASFRELEDRIGRLEPNWTVELIPPPLALPEPSFDGDGLDAAGEGTVATAAWAARRRGLGLVVTGGTPARRGAVIAALGMPEQLVRAVPGGARLTLAWDAAPPAMP